jgi:hypothetical protein
LNENQIPILEAIQLESNSAIILQRAQLLFLFDFGEDGKPISDPLLSISRSLLLKKLCRETGLSLQHLKKLSKSYRALGQKIGEILILERLITPMFWRVLTSRLLRSGTGGGWISSSKRGGK